MARQNATDLKASLEEKRKQIEARLKAIDAREKEQARKDDTRRKVVAGAIALEHFEKYATTPWALEFVQILEKYVEPRSRHLFPFLKPLAAVSGVSGEGGATAPPSQESLD